MIDVESLKDKSVLEISQLEPPDRKDQSVFFDIWHASLLLKYNCCQCSYFDKWINGTTWWYRKDSDDYITVGSNSNSIKWHEANVNV